MSVLNQPFKDWECIIGIETCKDRTEEIVREMTANDERFRIFTGPRSGSCSASRNTGIDMAVGEYVIFLDGDDTIAEGSLQRLHDKIAARPGADLYPCAILAYDEKSKKRELRDNFVKNSPTEMNGVEATLEISRLWSGAFCPMLQLTVFSRAFFVRHELKCIYGLRRQDSEFSPRAFYRAKRVVPLHEAYYLYRIRDNSISTSVNGYGPFLKDFAIIYKSLFAFYVLVSKERDFDSRVVPCWIQQWLPPLFFYWFNIRTVKNTSRAYRWETLSNLFADGFNDFDAILQSANFPKRTAGFFIRLFIKKSYLQWLVELFFRFYFQLSNIKNSKKSNFCTVLDN